MKVMENRHGTLTTASTTNTCIPMIHINNDGQYGIDDDDGTDDGDENNNTIITLVASYTIGHRP